MSCEEAFPAPEAVLKYWHRALKGDYWKDLDNLDRLLVEATLDEATEPGWTVRLVAGSEALKKLLSPEKPLSPGGLPLVLAVGHFRVRGDSHVLLAIPVLCNEDGILFWNPESPPRLNPLFLVPNSLPEDQIPFVLGTNDAAEHYRVNFPEGPVPWDELWERMAGWFFAVSGVRIEEFASPLDGIVPSLRVLELPVKPFAVVHLLSLLEYISKGRTPDKAKLALLMTLLQGTDPEAAEPLEQAVRKWSGGNAAHPESWATGTRGAWPLDPSQRSAVLHLVSMPEGSLLAVNGPPGTGKTAMMGSVVANAWTRPLLGDVLEPPCPVTIACAATNQAVTNVILGFSDFAHPVAFDRLESRWIDGVGSYGFFFPSVSQQQTGKWDKYQLLIKGRKLWSYGGACSGFVNDPRRADDWADWKERARTKYIEAFARFFPSPSILTLEDAVRRIRVDFERTHRLGASLQEGLDRLRTRGFSGRHRAQKHLAIRERQILESLSEVVRLDAEDANLHTRLATLNAALNEEEQSFQQVLVQLKGDLATAESAQANLQRLAETRCAFDRPTGGLFNQLLRWLTGFLPPFAQKRRVRAREHFDSVLGDLKDSTGLLLDEVDTLEKLDKALDEALRNASSQSAKARDKLKSTREARLHREPSQASLEGEQLKEDSTRIATEVKRVKATGLHAENRAAALRLWLASLEAFERELVELDREFKDTVQPSSVLQELLAALDMELLKPTTIERMENFLDLTVRSRCFHLGARYWEGRWLMSLGENDWGVTADPVADLRRHCMLAPCVVATCFSVPRLFEKTSGFGGYAFGAADLLIIDEAGQAAPEIAGPVFALAKRAVVVGDVEQLAPIWSYLSHEDDTLLEAEGLAMCAQDLVGRGLRVSEGSTMRAAQRCTRYSAGGSPRGLLLVRHYRCLPVIIGFCNELSYGGKLIPVRKPVYREGLPAMSWIECWGSARREKKGSLCNNQEADAIARWLRDERDRLAVLFPDHVELSQLVAVLSPYRSQIQLLKKVLSEILGKGETEDMVIGTVHSLQGAERPVVLFSLVSTPESATPFADLDNSMLNVAVSRAKEAFVLVAHPEVAFREASAAPSSRLGRYLRQHGSNLYLEEGGSETLKGL